MLHRVLSLTIVMAVGTSAGAEDSVDFDRDIRPLLLDRCFACHGPDEESREAELRLDLEEAAKENKMILAPGKPNDSELVYRIFAEDEDERMPPIKSEATPLTEEEKQLFVRWIEEGAPYTKHWAFQRPERSALPTVSEPGWAQNAIDHFVLAELDRNTLSPAPTASREKLLRRASLDLIGLPPTLEELDAFLNDTSADAFEKAVDGLLERPEYGERMAVEWLDGARYADSNGYQNDFSRNMWPWRDWVIEAFNQNMPYDQFTIEQIAGDLIPDATESQRIASGFNRNNHSVTEGGSIEEEWLVENMVDRVETTSTVFLALTMGCARCHDHKFDAITQREFYEFYAFFNSSADRGFYEETRGNTGPIVTMASDEDRARIAEFETEIVRAREEASEFQSVLGQNYKPWLEEVRSDSDFSGLPEATVQESLDGEIAAASLRPTDARAKWKRGLQRKALNLGAMSDAYLDLGDAITFEKEKAFTIAMWIRPETGGVLFSKAEGNDAGLGVEAKALEDGKIDVRIVNDYPDNAIHVVTDDRLEAGVWSHLVVSYDGSVKSEGVAIYLNGQATVAEIESNDLSQSPHSDKPFLIGTGPKGPHFAGALAQFAYYDNALDADQAKALTNASLSEAIDGRVGLRKRKHVRAHYDQTEQFELKNIRGVSLAKNAEKAAYESAIPTVMVMEESDDPRKTYRLMRGAYDKPDTSEEMQPSVPALLPPLPEGVTPNRMALAQWLVDESNPLTARVTVNRIWQRLFGQGLVTNSENFGIQADPPSHPELLDWLALRFIELDWDLKAIQKEIVMSATYQQDSAISEDLLERDPENRLLARGPRFRMPAELLRDSALHVSGLLVAKIGGPPVKPYQPEGMWRELAGGAGQGGYVPDEGDDLYRRSLYTYRKRTVPHATLGTFDAPSFENCSVRRARTNTPLQSLALLNDTTYAEAARKLAERMLTESDDPLTYGFRLATGRYPAENELQILQAGLSGYTATYKADPDTAEAMATVGESPTNESLDRVTLAAYTAVASVILNLDEVVTKE